ncbi:hypothetical protein [Anaerobranca gottschalkii]|nr:hypothetical protein [Anaerobranca gottschalkii]
MALSLITPAPSKIPTYYNNHKGIFKKSLTDVVDRNGIGYELMRYFLLGEKLKEFHNNRRLFIVSITRDGLNDDLEKRVNDFCYRSDYCRLTWNQLYSFIEKESVVNMIDKKILLHYLKGKTLGYNREGQLRTLL